MEEGKNILHLSSRAPISVFVCTSLLLSFKLASLIPATVSTSLLPTYSFPFGGISMHVPSICACHRSHHDSRNSFKVVPHRNILSKLTSVSSSAGLRTALELAHSLIFAKNEVSGMGSDKPSGSFRAKLPIK